jgi:hypothetical protein
LGRIFLKRPEIRVYLENALYRNGLRRDQFDLLIGFVLHEPHQK